MSSVQRESVCWKTFEMLAGLRPALVSGQYATAADFGEFDRKIIRVTLPGLVDVDIGLGITWIFQFVGIRCLQKPADFRALMDTLRHKPEQEGKAVYEQGYRNYIQKMATSPTPTATTLLPHRSACSQPAVSMQSLQAEIAALGNTIKFEIDGLKRTLRDATLPRARRRIGGQRSSSSLSSSSDSASGFTNAAAAAFNVSHIDTNQGWGG